MKRLRESESARAWPLALEWPSGEWEWRLESLCGSPSARLGPEWRWARAGFQKRILWQPTP